MIRNKNRVWRVAYTSDLAEVLASVSDPNSMKKFLRDAMTEKEIVEIAARLQAAKMLNQGEKYTSIINRTKLSSRTVARISDWMKNGCSGYQLVLSAHHHSPSGSRET